MGDLFSKEEKVLCHLQQDCGNKFPSCNYHPLDRKNWMSGLNLEKVHLNKVVWPGTHNSATNDVEIPVITSPFTKCKSLSIYYQLEKGTCILDIRVQEDRLVCHGILKNYSIDFVIQDIKKFLSETQSEIIILEIWTKYGHNDPPKFNKYLKNQLAEFLIHQDDHVFEKTIAELLPKRIICVWKRRNSPHPEAGDALWHAGYLKDDWIDIDWPWKMFHDNLENSNRQPRCPGIFFYRVENTLMAQLGNFLMVKPVTDWIHGHARLFISQCFSRGCADRLQIFSTDFIDEDFVDACVGLTHARIEVKA